MNCTVKKISANNICNSKGKLSQELLIEELYKQKRLFVKSGSDLLYLSGLDRPYYYERIYNNPLGRQRIRQELIAPDCDVYFSRTGILKETLSSIIENPKFIKEIKMVDHKVLLQNGVLDLETKCLTPLSSLGDDDCFLYEVKANYLERDSPMEDAPFFQKFLSTSLDDSLHGLYLEAFGYLLTPVTNMKKALLMVGKPNTGKSLTHELLKQLLPAGSISSVELDKIGATNENGELLGKQVNISGDIDVEKGVDMSAFKCAVSNEPIQTSAKYEVVKREPFMGKLSIASNNFPRISASELPAFIERIIFLTFDKEVKEKDRDLLNKLLNERDVIVTLALQQFMKKYKTNPFVQPEHSRQILQYYIDNTSPVKAFSRDCLEVADDTFLPTALLQMAVKSYCAVNGFEHPRDKDLKEHMVSEVNCKPIKKNLTTYHLGNRHGYLGIRLKEDSLNLLPDNYLSAYRHYISQARKDGEINAETGRNE